MKTPETFNPTPKDALPGARTVSAKAENPADGAFPRKTASIDGVTEYRLSNGLRILLLPDMTVPVITTNVVYLVGSRHENRGESGMAHLLEHLLFKPSANFGVQGGTRTPVETLNVIGARFNGTTSYDTTSYFATFPASAVNLLSVLALEADRMVNAAIEASDLWNETTQSGEMSIVRSEFEMGASDPVNVTLERIKSVAFDWHNYGNKVMGALSDIDNVDIRRLKAFYEKYYQPDNAILMVAGRFDEASTLSHIDMLFGGIAKPERFIAPPHTVEPAQDGERSVTIRRNGGSQFVGVGYHVAPGAHPDSPAMAILCRILTTTPSGRLHEALIETALAAHIDYDLTSTLQPGYCIFSAVVARDGDLDAVRGKMLGVLEGFADNPVTEAEFARARQQVLAAADITESSTTKLVSALTQAVSAGDWRLYFVQRDQLERIGVEAVQAAATKYLKPSNRTMGCFVPSEAVDRTEVPGVPDIDAIVGSYQGREIVRHSGIFDCSPTSIECGTRRYVLSNGMTCALLPKATKRGTVSMVLQLRMGTAVSLDGQALAGQFAAAMLMRGTRGHSRQKIKDVFDRLSAQVTVNGGAEGVTATIQTIGVNLMTCLELLVTILRNPSFEAREFEELKREMIARVAQDMAEPRPVAVNEFRRLLDPTENGHPHHVQSHADHIAALESMTLDQVRRFHDLFYGASAASLAAVGSVDADSLIVHVERLLGSWRAATPYRRIPAVYKKPEPAKLVLKIADKPTCALFVVRPLPSGRYDTHHPSLLLADHMLGGGTMRNRLADRIRQKEGLAYAVGSLLTYTGLGDDGLWLAYCICAPENVARVQELMREELGRTVADGFSEEELSGAKENWKKLDEVHRADDKRMAHRLAHYLGDDRTIKFDEELAVRIDRVTLSEINDLLRDAFDPNDLCTVMAGDFATVKTDC